MTNQEIINVGQQIYDETNVGANTSNRVGRVIKGIGENLKTVSDRTIGGEYTPTYTASHGYISATGTREESTSFFITTKFLVPAGSKITFVGKANGNMACIAKTDASESYYTVLVSGQSNSQNRTYEAIVDEDSYIIISYYGLSSITVTLRGLIDDVEDIKNEIASIDGNIQNLNGQLDDVRWINGETLQLQPVWNNGAIDANGNVVSGNGHKYSSPILIEYTGNIVFHSKTGGNYMAIAITDANGSSYSLGVMGATASQYNDYTIQAIAGQYISLIAYLPDGSNPTTQVLNVSPISGRTEEINQKVEASEEDISLINTKINELQIKTDPLNNVVKCVVFNGTDAYASFDPITLSTNGDSLEFDVEPDFRGAQTYNFLRNSVNSSHLGVFLSTLGFSIRANDNSYMFSNVTISPSNKRFRFKISYENGNVAVYIDGVKVDETNGVQKALTVDRLGYSGNSTYTAHWKGYIYSVNVNGQGEKELYELNGYTPVNTTIAYPNGMLTDEQNAFFEDSLMPKCVVSASANQVDVYTKLQRNNYIHFVIEHQTNSDVVQYGFKDLWRLTTAKISKYDDGVFTDETTLMVGAENEFAINLQGQGDYTGGYHGYERIDIDNACYVTFIVNGQEYTITELATLGTVNCDSFGYRQKSLLYTGRSLSYQEPFAWHVKSTTFKENGFGTRNFVLFDFTNAPNVNSMNILNLLKGLVCVHKNCASYVVGNDGTRHEASHPSVTVENWVTYQLHPTDARIKMYNGGLSCYLDSAIIGKTNLTGIDENGGYVSIYDRQNDCKYYSFAFINETIAVGNGDYIEVECDVKWMRNE